MSSNQQRQHFSPMGLFRFQESGLLAVIFLLGLFLTLKGGLVERPVFKVNAEGERERVFVTNKDGEQVPATEKKNKFLNAENLTQLAKDTSFIAIMAVGATFIIISGGIDLSVGAIYALASVMGAMVFRAYGPDGGLGNTSAWIGVPFGMVTCVGLATLCGFLNGGMIVSLKVHPFIITLGTMAIFRGI